MKMDLEKYLKEKRWKLDVEEPDEDAIWSGIQQKKSSRHFVLPSWFWKVAAIFLFAVLMTYTVTNRQNKNQVVVVTLADISKDLGQEEAQLKQLVSLKWEEVEQQLPTDKNDLKFLFDELRELDKVYADYQKDLYKTGPNEQIIEAMLDYYQKKIRLLNRMLMEIQKQKEHENKIVL
jgi:hypothetical protein